MADAHNKLDAAKSIFKYLYFEVGMVVKLAVKIASQLGLYNSSRGVVRDICLFTATAATRLTQSR